MRVSQFDFHLPEDQIASYPAEPRDAAKLLCVGKTCFYDRHIHDLPQLLSPGDLLVFNQSKVIPARLYGKRGEATVEILLHKRLGQGRWETFARPGKKLKPGDIIKFAEDFSATVESKNENGIVQLNFITATPSLTLPLKGEGTKSSKEECFLSPSPFREREGERVASEARFFALLSRYGQMPLPPYIPRHATPDKLDHERYQTIYAKEEGSVAAPTAGLHFTESLLQKLKGAGIRYAFVTLHVGGGTFLPVKTDDTEDHVMHSEWGEVSVETAELINQTKTNGGNIVAVGTTSLRLLESAADEAGRVYPYRNDTAIFITPGYRFKVVDKLLTNFHLPKSTLFMLVSAFSGLERMKEAYQHAISQKYRFYSYGDACLLEKQ